MPDDPRTPFEAPPSRSARERALARALAMAVGLALAFLAACAWLYLGDRTPRDIERLLQDPAVLEAATEKLVERAQGIWDTFPDADVGRVLQAGLEERRSGNIEVSTNEWGVRERAYVLPKPEGRTRIVFLGDSFVFGNGVAAEERMGSELEAALRERAGASDLEVLHLGMTDWNILAEASFLRRQLAELAPDLVVHVLIYNDLDDASSARGFGALAGFSSQNPAAADGLVATRHPFVMGFGSPARPSWLTAGLDGESRARYARSRAAIEELARAVEARGGRYLAMLYWPGFAAAARAGLLAGLREDQLTYVPESVFKDERYCVSKIDAHWNPAGMQRVARQVYALARERELLPSLALAPWPEADAVLREWHDLGAQEALRPATHELALGGRPLASAIDFTALDVDRAAQIHGGLLPAAPPAAGCFAAPYAALILRQAPGELAVLGRQLERPELGGTIRVFLDEVELGQIEQQSGVPISARFGVPAELRERAFVSLRFVASDWVYWGEGRRNCAAFLLERAGFEPER